MDVAAHWQREWAGAAEFGKVTEGGVTRRVSRAVEVLHASAPGARMRVMRAAYHSTSGPGVPASSFMLHSSRRVISSGSNFVDTPTTPSRPLEISSTPLDSSPDSNETENYKVTEPDDSEISEPSKWRRSTATSSIRMPSEESSSVDNASIIDLDANTYRNAPYSLRKNSYDSDTSDVHTPRKHHPVASPLLNSPTSLSTLKYKSLLNNSYDWNNRRKSYSFEDTSPLNDNLSYSNGTLAMDSSTDSGICKSSEVVNDEFSNGNKISNRLIDNNIMLQSQGRVSITVPIILETDENYQYKKNHDNNVCNRKIKKVGFSKTELHFAAESGKVNIIATDEKPPPSYDFRKRRNVFVPINENFDKPVTLFSDKSDNCSEVEKTFNFVKITNEISESDENTAATKSILKNKIPKPKPYLLGENMALGYTNDLKKENHVDDSSVLSPVSLINKQLQLENKYTSTNLTNNKFQRTTNKGPSAFVMLKNETINDEFNKNTEPMEKVYEMKENDARSVNSRLRFTQLSPTYGKAKTRQLRDSDLTYFGVKKDKISSVSRHNSNRTDVFESVRLIQQVSNSLANSETGSEGNAEYENIDINPTYLAIQRSQTRNDDNNHIVSSSNMYKNDKEQLSESHKSSNFTRPSRLRKSNNSMSPCRSISEPPKTNRANKSSYVGSENLQRMRTSPTRYFQDRVTIQTKSSAKKNKNFATIGKNSKNEIQNYDQLYVNIPNKVVSSSPVLPRRKTEDFPEYTLTNTTDYKKECSPKSRKSLDVKKAREHIKSEPSPTKNRTHRSRVLSTPESSLETKKSCIDESHSSRRTTKRQDFRTDFEYPRNKKEECKVLEKKTVSTIEDGNNSKKQERNNSHRHKSSNGVTKDLSERKLNEVTRKDEHRIYTDSKNREKPHKKESKNGSYKKSHRNEYIINYDDKNGTVSSVRKLKQEPVSLKTKNKSIENNRSNEQTKSKHKTSEKPLRK